MQGKAMVMVAAVAVATGIAMRPGVATAQEVRSMASDGTVSKVSWSAPTSASLPRTAGPAAGQAGIAVALRDGLTVMLPAGLAGRVDALLVRNDVRAVIAGLRDLMARRAAEAPLLRAAIIRYAADRHRQAGAAIDRAFAPGAGPRWRAETEPAPLRRGRPQNTFGSVMPADGIDAAPDAAGLGHGLRAIGPSGRAPETPPAGQGQGSLRFRIDGLPEGIPEGAAAVPAGPRRPGARPASSRGGRSSAGAPRRLVAPAIGTVVPALPPVASPSSPR